VETTSFSVRLEHSVGDYAICQVSVNFDIDGIHRKLPSKGEHCEETVQWQTFSTDECLQICIRTLRIYWTVCVKSGK
jgi:hypothetical protein